GSGSSGNQNDETYRGTGPFSEPETQVASAYVEGLSNLIGAIDFHSYSQLVLRPWGTTFADPPDVTVLRELGDLMAAEIFATYGMTYQSIPGIELYAAAGTAGDWFYGIEDLLGYSIELRDTGNFGFLLPASQIIPTAEENLNAIVGMAEYVGLPISIFHDVPSTVASDTPAPIEVRLVERAATIFPGSAMVRASIDGGAFVGSALSSAGGDSYTGTLPAAPCGSEISYYIEVNTTSGLVTYPSDAPSSVLTTAVLDLDVVFEDDAESDLGWSLADPGDTATTGRWERSDPSSTAAQPGDDHSPAGTLCFITDGRSGSGVGTYDIDGGETTLTSPAMDATGGDTYISYWRWYSNNQGSAPGTDSMPVEISNGGAWVLLEEVTDNAGAWVQREFRVADYVTPTATVRIRFRASDLGDGSIVEAGVDDVQLSSRGCDEVCGDYNGDGTRDIFDVLDYLADFEAQTPGADLNGDTVYDIFDILEFLSVFSDC
ncbi:MAG: hypothetical protein KDA28_13210, partial [Phycisphaerales bacterium]|nr:hypothetical protein [Phycisphaerales bacterium]